VPRPHEKAGKKHPQVAQSLGDGKARGIQTGKSQTNGKKLRANVRHDKDDLENRDRQFTLRPRARTIILLIHRCGEFAVKKVTHRSVFEHDLIARSEREALLAEIITFDGLWRSKVNGRIMRFGGTLAHCFVCSQLPTGAPESCRLPLLFLVRSYGYATFGTQWKKRQKWRHFRPSQKQRWPS
jgi:hypothetical protein